MKARIGLSLLCTCALFALTSGSAAAATVTVGSPLTAAFFAKGIGSYFTLTNTSLQEVGANVVSPISGTVVRWRVLDASGGAMNLRVLTPSGGGAYTGGPASAAETAPDLGLHTFPTSMPIQAGQAIGIDVRSGETLGMDDGAVGSMVLWGPRLYLGETRTPDATFNTEAAFNADVQPPPGLRSVARQSGPNTGGTTVTVDGHDLSGATQVAFGGVPGTHLHVVSDDRVKVRVPRELRSGAVPVSVVTPAGSAELPGAFTYRACVVPRLRGRGVTGSANALRRRGCRLGHVKGGGRSVARQSRRPGRELFFGARVNVRAR